VASQQNQNPKGYPRVFKSSKCVAVASQLNHNPKGYPRESIPGPVNVAVASQLNQNPIECPRVFSFHQ